MTFLKDLDDFNLRSSSKEFRDHSSQSEPFATKQDIKEKHFDGKYAAMWKRLITELLWTRAWGISACYQQQAVNTKANVVTHNDHAHSLEKEMLLFTDSMNALSLISPQLTEVPVPGQ